ncbi:MAG: hypothetical protein NPIRA05_13600 [Nitrospirales bacterium]|nr:MAG: hypothetical protein NPIRA05_13600 [Nitrospirales bacterium]
MKKLIALFGVGLYALTMAGCAPMNFAQPNAAFPVAGIYSDVQGGSLVLDNGATATKTGKACGHQILGIVAAGDTSVETAMANGGISKLVYVNQSYKNILFIYSEICTIARGN